MRMTLDETWKNCLSMWRWIAKEVRNGNPKGADSLKIEWTKAHDLYTSARSCFFCDYANALNGGCNKCPAWKIEPGFNCSAPEHDHTDNPIAFYNKLVSLNRKRLKDQKHRETMRNLNRQ